MFSEDPKVLREQAKILIRHAEGLLMEAERIEGLKFEPINREELSTELHKILLEEGRY